MQLFLSIPFCPCPKLKYLILLQFEKQKQTLPLGLESIIIFNMCDTVFI